MVASLHQVLIVEREMTRMRERIAQWQRSRPGSFSGAPVPEHAAMLRASMDLTRALAQLRKGK